MARNSTVLAILKNPAYAGTYVYGQGTFDLTRHTVGDTPLPLKWWGFLGQPETNVYAFAPMGLSDP